MDELALTEFHLRVTNSSSQGLSVFLEPWGDALEVAADSFVDFAVAGPIMPHMLEMEVRDGVTIWAWPGSVVDIVDGRPTEHRRQPAPPLSS